MTYVDENGLANDVAALRVALPKLAENDRQFAESLCVFYYRKGWLTERQEPHVRKLLDRANGVEPPKAQPVNVGSLAGINAMLTKAAQQGKRAPALLVAAGDLRLRLTVATQRAKVPGSINVVSAQSYDDWYGRVTQDGQYQPSRKYAPATITAIGLALKAMADDPAAAAGAYGKLTSRCCFCGRRLGEGEDERSVEVGYGPVCASRFGVPWGVKP